ncbi:MAG: TetR/AcrR family transcriptional regulator [Oscillospiraceae bacterium]
MPAVRKVSKEQIIDAAVDVLRDDGFSAINARSVAKKLGCSTQPIYFSFRNMEELKAALTERAIQMHTQRVRDSLRIHEGNDSRYSSYGMGFVKFAAEEKQLFRWLYLEGEQLGPYQNDFLTPEVISVITEEFGYEEDVARRFHQDMVYFTYGLAILANTDHLHLTEAELREAFRREFRALIAIYGKPAKLPEFAVKAGVVL